MADPNEPKKETVRITLPSTGQSGDTVRINLPPRPPAPSETTLARDTPSVTPPLLSASDTPPVAPRPVRPPPSPTSAPLPPPRKPPPPPTIGGNLLSEPIPPSSPTAAEIYPGAVSPDGAGPKKETARISLMPAAIPARADAVNMKKTQPLMTGPPRSIPPPALPVIVHPAEVDAPTNPISLALCWALLGVSALTFLIQIWNYFVG